MPIAICLLVSILSACSGGGGGGDKSGGGAGTVTFDGGGADTVTFDGGTLEELKAINPSLSFDNLEITGGLTLPFYSADTITANSLTIRAGGLIGYSYSTCEYRDAPSITLNVANDVIIEGEILLRGRSGAIISSGASCNSCYGQDGGDVGITAGGDITVSGRINNYGGAGASIHYVGLPSSPCSAGASGNLSLNAGGNMSFNDATIDNDAGHNFNNVYASSGTASIIAGNRFSMSGGSFSTTGALTLQTSLADIAGPITYGSLNESLGGAQDTTPPLLTLVNPQPYSSLDWHQPFQIQLQASDDGMGIRQVQVTGFGHDQAHYESEFVNGMLSVDIAQADEPTSLNLVVTDNKGLQTSTSVAGLSIAYPQEIEPNNNLLQAQALGAGGRIVGDIQTGDSGYASTSIRFYMRGQGDWRWFRRLAEDVYAVTLSASATRFRVDLDFTGNSTASDIDLYLLNSDGTSVLDVSLSDNIATGTYTESIIYSGASGGATYYIALQAYDVPTRVEYRLTRAY
jgi:hypothetical protein